LRSSRSRRSSGVNCGVAVTADNQGFPLPGDHDLFPDRDFPFPGSLEVCEFPYVMDLDMIPRTTEFAFVGREPLDQLGSDGGVVMVRGDVFDLRERLELEGDPAEFRIEGGLVFSLDCHRKAFHHSVFRDGPTGKPFGHLGYGGSVLACKGLEERCSHVPLQSVKPPSICGVCVELHVAAKFLAVPVDDIEIGIVSEFGAIDRLIFYRISVDLFLDHRWRNPQFDAAMADAMVVAYQDLVAEEPGFFGPAVGDQGFLGREFQFEMIAQERSQSVLDLFGFPFGPVEAEREVIRIADISQSSVVRIERIFRPEYPEFFAEGSEDILGCASFIESPDFCLQTVIFLIGFLLIASRGLGDECLFDELIEPVKVDIGEDRADDSTLRRAAEGGSVVPFFEVSRLEQILDQDQESVVVDLLSEDRHHDRMINIVETSFDITLDEPGCTCPAYEDVTQGCVASPFRSEAVGRGGELWLVVCFQKGAYDFLQQFIGPRWDAERAGLSILFGNESTTHGGPSISFISEEFDDSLDLPLRHSIHGFLCRSFGHRTGVSIDSPVRPQEQIRVVESSIDILQVLPLLASFSDYGECRFGVSHVAYLHVLVIRPPDPLRHVSGFPGRGLLWGLRHLRARAP
jgi:hypothetical protein